MQTCNPHGYDGTIARASGPSGSLTHRLRLAGNEAPTSSLLGPQVVDVPQNKPVTVSVQAAPKDAGIKSAILQADDPRTPGVDKQILATVVVSSEPLAVEVHSLAAGRAE